MSNTSPNTPQPFDFESAFGPTPAPTPAPVSSVSPTPVQQPFVAPVIATNESRGRSAPTTTRGQALALASLIVAVVAALAVGIGLYLAIASIRFPPLSLSDARDWLNLTVFGLCLGVLALAGSIVALVQSRPKVIATVALVSTLVLPIICALVGAKMGLDALADEMGGLWHELAAKLQGMLEGNDNGLIQLLKVVLGFFS